MRKERKLVPVHMGAPWRKGGYGTFHPHFVNPSNSHSALKNPPIKPKNLLITSLLEQILRKISAHNQNSNIRTNSDGLGFERVPDQ